jgi:hypothetical protein
MTYLEMTKNVIGTCNIPDGYFGKREDVLIALANNKVYFISLHGFFRAPIPPVIDKAEAIWTLKHHPNARHIKNIKEVIK